MEVDLNFHEFVSIFKKSGQRVMADLKILQSDCPRAFCHISKEQDFSKIWDLHWNIANNINFDYRPNLEKTNII